MIKHALPVPLLFLFLFPLLSTAQLPGQTLADATVALEAARPSQSLQILHQLPQSQWKLVHKELALQVYYQQEAFGRVINYGNELAKDYDLSSTAQLLMVKAAILSGRLTRVNEQLESIQSLIDPDEYQLVRGMIAIQVEDFETATQQFEAAIAINPESPMAWTLRGQVLEKAGFLKRALQAHQFAIELNPYCREAHEGKARIFLMQQQMQQAMEAYHQGIQLNPEARTLLINGSKLALDVANYDLARQFCLNAIHVFPKDAVFYANLGMSYFFNQDYDNSRPYLEKATRLRNDGADHYFLGLAAIRSRRMKQAHQHLEMALSLGFEREDLPQLVEHCRSILASFEESNSHHDFHRF